MLKIQIPHQVHCIAGHGVKAYDSKPACRPISGSACEIPWSLTPLLLMWSSQCRSWENRKPGCLASFTEALRGMVSYSPYLLCRASKWFFVFQGRKPCDFWGTPWYPCFRTISDTLQDERLRWAGKFLRAESLFAPATDGCRVLRALDGSKPNAILGEMNSHLYPLKYRCLGVECRVIRF